MQADGVGEGLEGLGEMFHGSIFWRIGVESTLKFSPCCNRSIGSIDLLESRTFICSIQKAVEFDRFKIGVVQLLPQADEFDGAPVTEPGGITYAPNNIYAICQSLLQIA